MSLKHRKVVFMSDETENSLKDFCYKKGFESRSDGIAYIIKNFDEKEKPETDRILIFINRIWLTAFPFVCGVFMIQFKTILFVLPALLSFWVDLSDIKRMVTKGVKHG